MTRRDDLPEPPANDIPAQSQSLPGPTYEHPEGLNDPGATDDTDDTSDEHDR